MTEVVGKVSASTVQSQAAGITQGTINAVSSDKFVFWAGLDGTNNMDSNPAYSGDTQSTAIGALSNQIADAGVANTVVKYYEGVGTPNNGGLLASVAPMLAAEKIARDVLRDYAYEGNKWLKDNPEKTGADLVLSMASFSRGAISLAMVTQILNQEGLVYEGVVLIPPGQASIAPPLVLSPVLTGSGGANLAIVGVDHATTVYAGNDDRIMYKQANYSNDVEIWLNGTHGDIGAFYDQGISGVVLQEYTEYFNLLRPGMASPVLPARQYDGSLMLNVHAETFGLDSPQNLSLGTSFANGTMVGSEQVGQLPVRNGDVTTYVDFKGQTVTMTREGNVVQSVVVSPPINGNYGEYQPFSYSDGFGNSYATKTDGQGKVLLALDGSPICTVTAKQSGDTVTTCDVTLSGKYLSKSIGLDIDHNGTVDQTTTTTFGIDGVTLTTVDTNGDNVIDQTIKTTQVGAGVTQTTGDNNGDGNFDTNTLITGSTSYNLNDFKNRQDAEYQLSNLYNSGVLSNSYWNQFTLDSANQCINLGNTYELPQANLFNFWLTDPIGAFYDSQSGIFDDAKGISHKTGVLVDANRAKVSAAQLVILDVNKDGQLSCTESAPLRFWQDVNEDGRLDAGEIVGVTQTIVSNDYVLYTQGNAKAGSSLTPSQATMPNSTLPSKVDTTQAVPASDYRAQRDGDEVYPVESGLLIWATNQIKLNWGRNAYNTMVGTDGNDSFNVNYFASASDDFRRYIGRVVNFLAGPGDDLMGGSVRNDNLWGGTGNDTLMGYAGNDKVYGEEGSDELWGQEGDDYVDGGIGDDILFGQVGNDTLNGGEGADFLVGFAVASAINQTLSIGETDDDCLYGGNGNDSLLGGLGNDYLDGGIDNDLMDGGVGEDTLFGGTGFDQLQGGDGNDILFGESDEDTLFGEAGNDILYGGAGADVLIGFTASNSPKQTLFSGETDEDLLYGEAGNDNIYGGFGNDLIDGGEGNDFLLGDDGNDSIFGGDGADELQGGGGDDQLLGQNGNDKLFGQMGDDHLWGGEGNDGLVGGVGNDHLDGGAGSDILIGGMGNDTLLGGANSDELQGNAGDDWLSGDEGDDNLFGQVGNDTLYGGDGNDYLSGFTASNEDKQALSTGETDDDYLYGGAGNDTLVGVLGNDYLDGGAGADVMVGGQGNDIYVVNSVNDTIYEKAGEGYDVAIASTNYLLNASIEELRLLEGYDIHGTGNAQDNKIIGNSSDNILDGVTGADTMIGGAGNDTYYVDNIGDAVVENANEGTDIVQSSISYTLGANIENLTLLDFSKPEKGLVDGRPVLVYGYPKRNELDYMQGDAVENYLGTCALTSIANLLTQTGRPTTESQVVTLAINNNWAVNTTGTSPYRLGGASVANQRSILESYKIRNDVIYGYNETGLANLIQSGRGIVVGVNAGRLWGESAYVGDGGANHGITITGAAYNIADGGLAGFFIADSGRGAVSDMTRFVNIDLFRQAANVVNAYALYTIEPVKYWHESIDATGNGLDNTLIGNRGNNLLQGLDGNDFLNGAAGDDVLDGGGGNDHLSGGDGADVYLFGMGSGQDIIDNIDSDNGVNVDAIQVGVSSADVMLSHSDDDLIIGINGASDNLRVLHYFFAEGASNYTVESIKFADGVTWDIAAVKNKMPAVSDSWSGANHMVGGSGNDIYTVDNQGDIVDEKEGEGSDLVLSSISYALGANLENLTLVGSVAISGTGNELNNIIIGNAANNILDGSFGADTMVGGIGADTYIVDDPDDIVIEKCGEAWGADELAVPDGWGDTVRSSVSFTLGDNVETLVLTGMLAVNGVGNKLGNTLIGNSCDNYLIGLAGNDYLVGGEGEDTMLGGVGDDRYNIDNIGDVAVEGVNEGIDYVTASVSYSVGENIEYVSLGGVADINATGNNQGNTIYGNAGSNIFDGQAGNDNFYDIAGGSDTYIFGHGYDRDIVFDQDVNGRRYIDTVQMKADLLPDDLILSSDGISLFFKVIGTLDQLEIRNWCLGDSYKIERVIFSNGVEWGGDEIQNILNAGTPNDDSLYGTEFTDKIYGQVGNDQLYGRNGNDQLYGGDGSDVLWGEVGDDILDGGVGADRMIGGLGNDTYHLNMDDDIVYYGSEYHFDVSKDEIIEYAGEGIDTIVLSSSKSNAPSFTLSANVENLVMVGTPYHGFGNELNNVITGSDSANGLRGLAGNDTLDGGGGIDWLLGGEGDDLLIGGDGDDLLEGGAGDNQLFGGDGNDTFTLGDGNNIVFGGSGNNGGTGGSGNTYYSGGDGSDKFSGGSGNNILQGGDGKDWFKADSGNDFIDGGSGDEFINAGSGSNMIIGGLGNDLLYIATGQDTLLFNKGDGKDTYWVADGRYPVGGVGNDTLSLGGGISYEDLSFSKTGSDLVLKIGASDQITLNWWYGGTPSRPVATLQMVAEAIADFSGSSSDPLKDNKIETFDFAGLVGAFEAACAVNPGITSWALTDALTQFHLSGSNEAAMGGDLAYQYGKNGTLAGIGLTSAQQVISDANFGTQAQTLRPLSGLQEGAVKLS